MPEKSRGTIGIIENDPDLNSMLRSFMQELGFKAACTNLSELRSHRKAYRNFMRKYNPRALIVDTPYPYEENSNFIRKITGYDVSYGKPIILATTNRVIVERTLPEKGKVKYLEKPFDLETLSGIIDNLLGPTYA